MQKQLHVPLTTRVRLVKTVPRVQGQDMDLKKKEVYRIIYFSILEFSEALA